MTAIVRMMTRKKTPNIAVFRRKSGSADGLLRHLVSNVACAINLHMPPWIYGILFLGCTLIYAVIHDVLVKKIQKIPVGEILKNRE